MLALEKVPLTPDCREFASAFEHAAIGMALVSPEGDYIHVNRALCRILGYSEAELLATDFQSLTLPEDLQVGLRQLDRLLRGEIDSYHAEKRYLHKSGRIITAHLSVSLIREDDGTPLYFITQVQDISPHKRAMEEARIHDTRLAALVEQLPMGVVMENEERRIILANRRLCQMLQLPCSPEEMKDRDCVEIAEECSHLFARPEFVFNRMREITGNRRPVRNETLEMADGRLLRRDYIPVFMDHEFRGNLWLFRDAVTGNGRG